MRGTFPVLEFSSGPGLASNRRAGEASRAPAPCGGPERADRFSDESGDWGADTCLLNPEGFRHAPFSREGCLIFVKLRQAAGARQRLYSEGGCTLYAKYDGLAGLRGASQD